MAGLVPAIPIHKAKRCLPKRDHRVTTLRAGPVMTREKLCVGNYAATMLGATRRS